MAPPGYDGSIRIDSRIDAKGFNAGIAGMIGKLKALAIAVGAAFAARAIANFGKTAVDEASAMASALIGLQSVVEGTGNSWAKAQEFINEFTADGLVPAKNAITAYKNLLLRGYDTSQIEKTLRALKDSAAFGRQGQLTMGVAIERASEGLKNENSLLVDNAGVTRNVAQLWKDYADSIGTSVANLTKQQKIQAEVNGILNETRFQTGDAAKAANTYAGQVSALGVSFLNLRVAIANILIPIITRIIPIIRAAIDALTIYFNRLATIVSIFFGVDLSQAANQTGDVADNTQDAADAQAELADNTEAAGKAAKGALAAFDQLNVLQRGDETAAPSEGPTVPVLAVDAPETDKSLQSIRDKIENFKAKLLELLQPAREAFDRLMARLEPLRQTFIKTLGWVFENILVPFGKWALESFLPAFLDLLAAGFRALNAVLVVLSPVFSWLWEHVIKPFGAYLAETVIVNLKSMTYFLNKLAEWLEAHPDLFADIIAGAERAWSNVVSILSGAREWFQERVIDPIIQLFAPMWEFIAILANNAVVTIQFAWGKLKDWFKEHVIDPIAEFFSGMWEKIGGSASNAAKPIQDAFGGPLDWIRDRFAGTFGDIQEIVKGAINNIIGFLNRMLSGIAEGVNGIITGLNAFGTQVPGWIAIPNVTAPQIPRLATGAVIPPNAEFAAILGDQRGHRNIEAPEPLLRQLIREELGNIQADIKIEFGGSLGALVRELKPRIDKETVRIGGSLVKGGTSI